MTPEYLRPATPIPPNFTTKSSANLPNIHEEWWQSFRNPTLSNLVTQANVENTDIAAAIHRVEQARATFDIARSSLVPVIDVTANGTVTGSDGRNIFGRDNRKQTIGPSLGYDFDIFGGNRAATDSARADVASSEFGREAVVLAIQAEVANTYFALILARERLRISDKTIRNAADVLRIAEASLKVGASTTLDVAQQQSGLEFARASRASFFEASKNAENALAVLIGQAAGTVRVNGTHLEKIKAPTITLGQPAALLYRRPDIRRAEADLMAANADIGVARAALFPSLSLNLDAALALNPVSTAISAGSSLLAPIFQGGRLKAGVRLSEARKAELVETYRKTVLVALQEVEDALAAVKGSYQRVLALTAGLNQARKAYGLSRTLYRAGSADFQTLLDVQRTLFEAEDRLALARFDQLRAAVNLIQALGGGWVEKSLPSLPRVARYPT